jgi:hypothetical protein
VQDAFLIFVLPDNHAGLVNSPESGGKGPRTLTVVNVKVNVGALAAFAAIMNTRTNPSIRTELFLVLIWFSSVHDNESGSLRRIPIPQSKALAIVYLTYLTGRNTGNTQKPPSRIARLPNFGSV